MKKTLLPVLLLLVGCGQTDDDAFGWKIVEGVFECKNPDIQSGDSVCTWFCRDFKQKKVDIIARYDNEKFYLTVHDSKNCGRSTEFNPSNFNPLVD